MPAFSLDPRQIADALLKNHFHLGDLPRDQQGLYALFDHEGQIRYVGQTADAGGFRRRIYEKHVTGSIHGRPGTSGRSHKYASAYIPLMGREHAPRFVRCKCTATIFSIVGRPLDVPRNDPALKAYGTNLRALENQVVATLRERGFALDWNGELV